MPRKNLIRSAEHYYHVTCRANNKEWFSLPLSKVWNFACESIFIAQKKHFVVISQFVLMNNHYHLLIKTPNQNLDHFMYEFNKNFSLKIRFATGRINRIFGGRYKWSIINNGNYLFTVYKYIYQNPIRANIVSKSEHYIFSTLGYEFTNKIANLGFQFSSLLDDFHTVFDINEYFSLDKQLEIKRGLLKTQFKLIIKRKY